MTGGRPVVFEYTPPDIPYQSWLLAYLSLAGMLTFSLAIVLITWCERMAKKRTRKRALAERDEKIVPPRCEAKAQEMGLESVQEWKEYFTRDEAFVPE